MTQASAVIKGGPISIADLKEKEKYFSGDEVKQVDQLAKDNKPIKDYWLVVLENYFQ